MFRIFFLAISLLFFTAPLSCKEIDAQKEEFLREESTSSEKQTPLESKAILIKTALLLSGLVGMLYGGAYFIKKIGGNRFSPTGADNGIKLIERQFISPKTAVWLLEVKGQSVIVVDAQNGVAIHTLTTPSTKENVV